MTSMTSDYNVAYPKRIDLEHTDMEIRGKNFKNVKKEIETEK